MAEEQKQDLFKVWTAIAVEALLYLLKRWYFLVLAIGLAAGYGYYKTRSIKPTYTANYTFVLSTDQRSGNGVAAGLAAQLGFDGITSSPDNIFAGDNIIELFKSRKLIGMALFSVVDTVSHQTLLNYIIKKQYPKIYKKLGPLGNSPDKSDTSRTRIYRMIIGKLSRSFMVVKKDKKLIFYVINATGPDADVAYYTAKYMLSETAQYFIDTKTKVAASSVQLLQHEADSLAGVLSHNYNSTAAMTDRTYNLNPSITIQRSGLLFNQAKANAIAGAYSEVMRNLEIAKINLQKETPLYRIIDEPELPLIASRPSKLRYFMYTTAVSLFLMIGILVGFRFKNDILAKFK